MRDSEKTSKGGSWEWSTAKGSNLKTRKWVPEGKPAATKAAATPSAKTKVKAPATTKDPMKGYRKGDVTMTSLDKGGRGDGKLETVVRRSDAAIKRAEAKPKASTGGPARTPRPKFDVSYTRWKGMDRAERERLGLPLSDIGGELGFNRFVYGITGKDYKMRTK